MSISQSGDDNGTDNDIDNESVSRASDIIMPVD